MKFGAIWIVCVGFLCLVCSVSSVSVEGPQIEHYPFYEDGSRITSIGDFRTTDISFLENKVDGQIVYSRQLERGKWIHNVFSVESRRYLKRHVVTQQSSIGIFENYTKAGPFAYTDPRRKFISMHVPGLGDFDPVCQLYESYYYVNETDQSSQRRLFFITVTGDQPVKVEKNCTESWDGDGTVLAFSLSLGLVAPINDGQNLYIPLPEGISIMPAKKELFLSLTQPLAISPTTWIVPDGWLFENDAFKRENENPLISPSFLFHNSMRIKALLHQFPFNK